MRQTRFKELGYDNFGKGCWRIIDAESGSAVGPIYKTKAELLADLFRYATNYSCEVQIPDEIQQKWDGISQPIVNALASTDLTVCGCQIQIDRSGVGHAWRDIDAEDIPVNVRQEIEGEIIDGVQPYRNFVASNGCHYRWQ